MSVETLAKAFVAGAKAHKPEIMIGLGLAAGAGAIFAAAKETPVCLEAYEEEKKKLEPVTVTDEEGNETTVPAELGWKTKAIIFGKCYWKAAVLEALSIFLIVYGSKIRLDGYAALAAVYGVTKSELDDLKDVIAKQPENWKKKFAEKKAETHIDQTKPEDIPAERMSNAEVPMPLPLFWDDQAKVYFRLSEEDLRDALAEFTNRINTDPFGSTSMNDWMREIGHEEVANGDYYLMTLNDPDWDGPLKYSQIGVKSSPTGEPARAMSFSKDYHLDTRGLYPTV